jgi:hypothetical protein
VCQHSLSSSARLLGERALTVCLESPGLLVVASIGRGDSELGVGTEGSVATALNRQRNRELAV